MAKLSITEVQRTDIVEAVDQHIHDAFSEGVSSPEAPNALPPMELYSGLGFDQATGKDLKLSIRLPFRQVIAAIAKVLNIKKPLPNGFSGAVDVSTPSGTQTLNVQDGFIVGAGGGGDGGGGGVVTMEVACQLTDAVGDFIIPTAGAVRTVRKVDITNPALTPTIGVIISKPTSTTATIQTAGAVEGIYSGLAPGQRYFVGATARPTAWPISGVSSGTEYSVQVVGVALDSSSLLLMPNANMTQLVA